MKKIIFYLFISAAFISLGYFTYSNFCVTTDDENLYYKLLDRKVTLTSCEALKRKPLCQNRENVQKDIFVMQNKSRLHFRISSEISSIRLTEKKDNIEFIENLENIKCLVQDKIEYNPDKNIFEQKLRYFTAKTGTYTYPSHKFVTDAINLYFFEIPGNTLPNNIDLFAPHLKGFAKEVSFLLTDKTPELNASHFRACFDVDKEIR